jgi:hypothetical protein
MPTLDILRRIVAVEAEPGCRLRIVYDSGETITVDFTPVIRKGGVFAQLADPVVFRQVCVDPRGRSVRWPGDIDFCADAVWLKAHGSVEVA